MARSREDAIRKVLACLALAAPKSGATEPERATAKLMAEKLMLEHSIQAEDVRASAPERFRPQPPEDVRPPENVTIVVNLGGVFFQGRFRHNFAQGFSVFEGAEFSGSNTTGGW